MTKRLRFSGFTIVELLIVIIIIGILATIVIVSYKGITEKAHESSLMSDLNNASRLLEVAKTSNMDYPADLSTLRNGSPLIASKDNKLAYNVSADKSSYCLAASYPTTNPTMTLVVTEEGGVPAAGDCSGSIAVPPCTTDTYVIGDTGPGGGTVFYDKGSCSDGWRYMEVDNSNKYGYASETTPWCDTATLLGTSTGIGMGRLNTSKIVAGCTNSIAKQVIDFRGGGKSDWFLPSLDEMKEIRNKRSKIPGSVCAGDNYSLSSSEFNASSVYWLVTGIGDCNTVYNNGSKTYADKYVFIFPARQF